MTDGNRLNYMRARYYSAEIRRFVNQDVLLGNVADGQSLNRFAFVMGNPVSFVDPFGLEAWNMSDPDAFLSCIFERAFGWMFELNVPRPYGGVGVYADYHILFFGQNTELSFISDVESGCGFQTDCGSIGLGLFSGYGTTIPIGLSMSDIESSLSGNSIGMSLDFGNCAVAYGLAFSLGYNENGMTSIGSSGGLARAGKGCGIAATIDICSTKSKCLWGGSNE